MNKQQAIEHMTNLFEKMNPTFLDKGGHDFPKRLVEQYLKAPFLTDASLKEI